MTEIDPAVLSQLNRIEQMLEQLLGQFAPAKVDHRAAGQRLTALAKVDPQGAIELARKLDKENNHRLAQERAAARKGQKRRAAMPANNARSSLAASP